MNANFKPIRFGEAPVGNLRWRAPVLITEYEDPVQGHLNEEIMCSQLGKGGQEDCLFLKIQVMKSVLDNKEKIPVLFYLHGGGFVGGTGMREHHWTVKGSLILTLKIYNFLASILTAPSLGIKHASLHKMIPK